MSGSKSNQAGRWDRERQAAMTFTQIGNALGIPRRDAYLIYKRAIRKLRMRPRVLAQLAALANDLDHGRKGEYE